MSKPHPYEKTGIPVSLLERARAVLCGTVSYHVYLSGARSFVDGSASLSIGLLVYVGANGSDHYMDREAKSAR